MEEQQQQLDGKDKNLGAGAGGVLGRGVNNVDQPGGVGGERSGGKREWGGGGEWREKVGVRRVRGRRRGRGNGEGYEEEGVGGGGEERGEASPWTRGWYGAVAGGQPWREGGVDSRVNNIYMN